MGNAKFNNYYKPLGSRDDCSVLISISDCKVHTAAILNHLKRIMCLPVSDKYVGDLCECRQAYTDCNKLDPTFFTQGPFYKLCRGSVEGWLQANNIHRVATMYCITYNDKHTIVSDCWGWGCTVVLLDT